MYFFFFSSRRRHTRSKRDWSSDVCSSDLSRLCLAGAKWEARSPGIVRGDGRRRNSWAIGESEKRGLLLQVPRPPGAGNRDGGSVRGMAAPAYPRGLGLPRSTGDDHGAAIYFPLPREALQLWLSGVPQPRGSGRTLV